MVRVRLDVGLQVEVKGFTEIEWVGVREGECVRDTSYTRAHHTHYAYIRTTQEHTRTRARTHTHARTRIPVQSTRILNHSRVLSGAKNLISRGWRLASGLNVIRMAASGG